LELAHKHKVPIPGFGAVSVEALDAGNEAHQPAVDALKKAVHVGEICEDLADYLQAFEFTINCMADSDALERLAFELAEDAHAENVRWLEVRYAPSLMLRHGLSMDDTVAAVAKGLDRAEKKLGIHSGQILCSLRSDSVDLAMETAHLAAHLYQAGRDRVLAYDLAGDELHHDTVDFEDALELCVEQGLPFTLHCGEAKGADAIADSLALGADRLGHGTRLPEDMELLKAVAWAQIPLEICLTSNLQTQTINTYADHPLRLFLEHDLPITLCTDNRLMSDITLSDELHTAVKAFDLGPRQIYKIIMYGFLYSFAPEQIKDQLIDQANEQLMELLEV